LGEYFGWTKGTWGIADFLAQCTEEEIPEWLRNACTRLMAACTVAPADSEQAGVAEVAGAGKGVRADAAQ
jgi:putative ATP-dependent endonuclease of OLD family